MIAAGRPITVFTLLRAKLFGISAEQAVLDLRTTFESERRLEYESSYDYGNALESRLAVTDDRPAFAVGDGVLVAGAPGEVIGEVLQLVAPEDMPQIEGAPPAKVVQAFLREWRVDLLVLIAHKREGQEVCFFALRHPGGWRDLRGQDIQVTSFTEQRMTTGPSAG